MGLEKRLTRGVTIQALANHRGSEYADKAVTGREERSAKLAELYELHYLVYEDHCPENGPALSITIISLSAVILFIFPH